MTMEDTKGSALIELFKASRSLCLLQVVLGLGDFTYDRRGGGYEDGEVTKVKEHEGAIAFRERTKETVRARTKLMEVADDGKLRGRGWEGLNTASIDNSRALLEEEER
ncbi:hypothetical protein IEQ34_008245 [Dendrobium chrysotoxum]|uniref:Uncharacterized protein n=1 Tax=Dendrobium chrysotoxum TaxID=161865 RepID=A0AAV7H6P7_DENCH|nr:hypothetical protein IEQ34_008245 [Dendrobium chrysotoxum]